MFHLTPLWLELKPHHSEVKILNCLISLHTIVVGILIFFTKIQIYWTGQKNHPSGTESVLTVRQENMAYVMKIHNFKRRLILPHSSLFIPLSTFL